MINIDNMTNQELLDQGFTMSHILTLRNQNNVKVKSPANTSNRVVGFRGTIEEGIQTVLSRTPSLSDLQVIDELHALKVELYEQERRQVSLKLMDMYHEGKLTRVKRRVYEYSLV